MVADGPVEPGVGESVRRPGQGGEETARQLVLASGSALEDLEAAGDAVRDGVVVADVEVQERMLLQASPIPAVEPGRRGDAERSGDPPARARARRPRRGRAPATSDSLGRRRACAPRAGYARRNRRGPLPAPPAGARRCKE